MRRVQLAVLPLLFATAACSLRGRERLIPAPSNGTTPAVEVGCPYAKSSQVRNTVTLSFVVLKNGSVAPSSIRFTPEHHDTDNQVFIQRAVDIARGCEYKPAMSNGEPVESTVRKTFYFGEN